MNSLRLKENEWWNLSKTKQVQAFHSKGDHRNP